MPCHAMRFPPTSGASSHTIPTATALACNHVGIRCARAQAQSLCGDDPALAAACEWCGVCVCWGGSRTLAVFPWVWEGDLAIHLLQLGGQRIALTEHLPSSTHATARIQESADCQHVATCCDMLEHVATCCSAAPVIRATLSAQTERCLCSCVRCGRALGSCSDAMLRPGFAGYKAPCESAVAGARPSLAARPRALSGTPRFSPPGARPAAAATQRSRPD